MNGSNNDGKACLNYKKNDVMGCGRKLKKDKQKYDIYEGEHCQHCNEVLLALCVTHHMPSVEENKTGELSVTLLISVCPTSKLYLYGFLQCFM